MTGKGRLHVIMIMALTGMCLSQFLLPFYVHAADIGIINTTVYEGDIYVYIRGITQVQDGISVQIGNTACSSDQVSAVPFQDMEISVKTLVLIDNSQSISEKGQEDTREIMEGLIAASLENEQIKIGTFSDKASYLCDYTGDKDILNNVINGISYYDQNSFLSDVLYEEMNALTEKVTDSCMRILVISDGADDNSIGYTNDEIRSYIGENNYQVYTVGIPEKDNSKELEVLFSFSRAAKSSYFLMDGNISAEEVVNTLRQDQEGVCVKITPEESLKDGSEKNILLQLNGSEGSVQLTTSVYMPFGAGIPVNESVSENTVTSDAAEVSAVTEAPAVIEASAVTEAHAVTEASGTTDLPAVSERNGETLEEVGRKSIAELKDSIPLFPIIAGITLAALAAAATIILLLLRKNKKQKEEGENYKKTFEDKLSDLPETGKKEKSAEDGDTVIRPPKQPEKDGDSGDTQGIWLGTPIRYYLVLKCVDIPNVMYKVPVEDSVSIGRAKDSDIVLDDPEVSRNHCEILLRGDSLYVRDCDSRNHTFYENVSVYGEVPVTSGGKLEIGAHIYCVELVKES